MFGPILVCGICIGVYTAIRAHGLLSDWRVTIASGFLGLCSGMAVGGLLLVPVSRVYRALRPHGMIAQRITEALTGGSQYWFDRLAIVFGYVYKACNLIFSVAADRALRSC